MNLTTLTTEQDFINAATKPILQMVSKKEIPYHIALSGGSTPAPIYKALSTNPEAVTSNIHYYQVDERYVPTDHPDSNYKLITETLAPSNFHPFNTSLPIPEAITDYEKHIQDITFDLTILGLGPDGHTASIFPHSPIIHETKHLTAHTTTNQFAITDRLTLTFPKILQSKHLILLLKGKEKEQILNDLLHSDKTLDELPAKALLSHKNLEILYLKA